VHGQGLMVLRAYLVQHLAGAPAWQRAGARAGLVALALALAAAGVILLHPALLVVGLLMLAGLARRPWRASRLRAGGRPVR
jgi:hypothetical protein